MERMEGCRKAIEWVLRRSVAELALLEEEIDQRVLMHPRLIQAEV
jgi:hypothetical protein